MSAGDLVTLLEGWCSADKPALSSPWRAAVDFDGRAYELTIATDGHALCAAVEGGIAADLSHAQLVALLGTRPRVNAAGAPTYWQPIDAARKVDRTGPMRLNAALLGRVADVQRFLGRAVKAALRARLSEAQQGLTRAQQRTDKRCLDIRARLDILQDGGEPALAVIEVAHPLDPIYWSVSPLTGATHAPPLAFVGAIMPCRF